MHSDDVSLLEQPRRLEPEVMEMLSNAVPPPPAFSSILEVVLIRVRIGSPVLRGGVLDGVVVVVGGQVIATATD